MRPKNLKTKIKHERLFLRFYIEPAERGKKQFIDHQSRGIIPRHPDLYYSALSQGKKNFDFLCREYEQLYINGEWWGFFQLWKDWKGERWILPMLCGWYPKITKRRLPKWLTHEVSEEEISREIRKEFKSGM